MEENLIQTAIAGLLHDVGKVEQRARLDPWNPAPGVEGEGQPVHATWTIYFVQNHVPQPYRAAALAGAYHHAPENNPGEEKGLSELIALADKLSAGERADQIDRSKKPPQQMVTIFDRLQMGAERTGSGWNYLPLKPLALQEAVIFPGQAEETASGGEAYEELRDQLRASAGRKISDPVTYLENLLSAFQQLTWCVPSAYYHSIPDVSLYDHSRMTAALAACLVELGESRVGQLLAAVKNDFAGKASPAENDLLQDPVALLVGGDISGVQDFIYTLSSKGAARTLRGRSFYLQLLGEAVLRFVLRYLDLPYTNVIYSGGSNFFLLAPLSAAGKLDRLRKLVTQKLLRHHGTELYLAIGSTPVPAVGFRIGQFPHYWGEMHAAIARAKQQRYTELEDELYPQIFARPESGGNPESTCSVCGSDRMQTHPFDPGREEQDRICTLCESFIEQIGKDLPRARFIALGIGEPAEQAPQDARNALAEFGLQFAFLERADPPPDLPGAERAVIWALDDPPASGYPRAADLPTVAALRYTVNLIPQVRDQDEADAINDRLSQAEKADPARVGQTKTFTHLEAQSGGFKRLGVLRMDVDNLGAIFQHGFDLPAGEGSLATLARLATLSFQISLFFEGWLKVICDDYPELVYAVYAGGDDLFLIAPWHIVPGLARRIRQDFGRYTGEHPGLGLSGGMAFINGKYPIYQAAEDAHEAEKQAKDYPGKDDPGKDAFSIMGQALSWGDFDLLTARKEQLVRMVTKRAEDSQGLDGPASILQTLRQLAMQEAQAAEKRPRPVWGPWTWQGAYRLSRLVKQYEDKAELSRAIEGVRDDLAQNDFQEIYPWGMAARWAQLSIRKSDQEE